MDISEASAPPSSPAKLTDRFLAYLLDTVPFVTGYYAGLILLIVRWQRWPNTPQTWNRVLLVWLCAYVSYHWIGNVLGATAGKWMMGLRVRRLDGGPLGAGRSLVRALGLLASTPLFNLGFLWAFFQADSRTWHDLLAGSQVTEARSKSAGESLLTAFLSFIVLAIILGATWWSYMIRPTPADLAAVSRARDGLKILARIEDKHKAASGTYSDKLAELAVASGDVERFKSALREIFDPNGFRIQADRERYVLQARAKDRRRTVVALSGPTSTAVPVP